MGDLVPFEAPSLDSLVSGLGPAVNAIKRIQRLYRARRAPQSLTSWQRRVRSVEDAAHNRRQTSMAKRRRVAGSKRKYGVSSRVRGPPRKLLKGTTNSGRARLGKFNKKMIKKPRVKGCNFELVTSGTVTNSTNRRYPVLVGHTTCGPSRMFLIGIRGLVKLIAQKMTMDFKTWDEYVQVTRVGADTTGPQAAVSFTIFYQYQGATGGDLLENNFDVLTRVSWDDVALGLANQIKDLLNNDAAGGELSKFSIEKIWVQTQHQSTTPSQSIKDEATCIMAGKDIFVELDCYSKLVIQNRTPAVTIGTDETTNRNDIAANPLVGKAYYMTEGMAPLSRISPITGGGNGAVVRGTDRTGVIFASPDSFPTENGRQYFAIPAHHAFRNVKGTSQVSLIPGNVKSSIVKYHRKMRLNTFLLKMRQAVRTIPDGVSLKSSADFPDHPLAKGVFFLLKKSLHDGSVNDPFPSVAWQVNQKTNVSCTHKRSVYVTNFKEEA